MARRTPEIPGNSVQEVPITVNSEEGLGRYNRAKRRTFKPDNKYEAKVHAEIKQVAARLTQSQAYFNSQISQHERVFSRIAYHGDPFGKDYLESRYILPDLIEKGAIVNLRTQAEKPELFEQLESYNMFSRELGKNWFNPGTSIFDIEKMELPLSIDNISRVNRMFYRGFLGKFAGEEPSDFNPIRQILMYLPVIASARPDLKGTIPQKLNPLVERITDYFDYYTDLTVNMNLSDEDEYNFYWMLTRGIPVLPQALGCFLPGRLGITPSSANKIYDLHDLSSPLLWKGTWDKTFKCSREETKFAYRKNNLPPDLDKYQHRDLEMDQKASIHLPNLDKKELITGEDIDSLMKKAIDLKGGIQKAIRREQDKRLIIALPETSIARHLIVGSQNREVLMLIAIFPDKTHLTLELAKDRLNPNSLRLYGLPPKLEISNPNLEELVLSDFLPPLLSRFEERTPESKPYQIIETKFEPAPYVPEPKERKPGKDHNRVLSPIKAWLSQEPPPPNPEIHQKVRRVKYSEEKINALLKGRARPNDIKKIMRVLSGFEYGQNPYKTIKWSGGEKTILRAGHLRLGLNHLGQSNYDLELVKDRNPFYEPYSDYKVK